MEEPGEEVHGVVPVAGRTRVLRGGSAVHQIADNPDPASRPFQGERSSERGLLSAIRRTLERRLSSENIVRNAVVLRDALSSLYNSGRQSTRDAFVVAGRATASAYQIATTTVAAADLPWPLHTVRDVAVMPAVRGLENTIVFIVTPGAIQGVYGQVRDRSESLPVVGPLVFTPTFNVVEQGCAVALGFTRVTLMIVAAPFPSRETVAYVVAAGYNGVVQGVELTGDVLRETYYYVRLIDVQIQRAVNRVQWDLLGNGPYLELPHERRVEVRARLCDRYLATREPLRRYELLMALRLHNGSLWAELVQAGELLRRRGGADFDGDLWLDDDAPWRKRRKQPGDRATSIWQEGGFGIYGFPLGAIEPEAYKHQLSQAEGGPIPWPSDTMDHIPLHQWFVASGALPGEYEVDTESRWRAFSVAENCRLEAHYARFLTNLGSSYTSLSDEFPEELDGIGGALGSRGLKMPSVRKTRTPDRRRAEQGDTDRDFRKHGIDPDSFISDSIVRVLAKGRTQRSCLYKSSPTPFQSTSGFDVPVEQGRHVVNLALGRHFPVYWRFMEPPLDVRNSVSFDSDKDSDDVQDATGPFEDFQSPPKLKKKSSNRRNKYEEKPDPLVLGEKVIRAMWLIEKAKPRKRAKSKSNDSDPEAPEQTETQEEEQEEAEYTWEKQPLPQLSAAILEDAYQFLRWHLSRQSRTKPEEPLIETSKPGMLRQRSESSDEPSTAYRSSENIFEQLSQDADEELGRPKAPNNRFAGWLRKRETALLTITILDWNGTPLLVQFRSLTEIVASRRNFSSTLIPFARYRIYRGHPSATRSGEARLSRKLGFSRHRSLERELHSQSTEPLNGEFTSSSSSSFEAEGSALKKTVKDSLDEPVDHLVLVVHGIGEALEPNDMGVIQLRSLVQCCNQLRRNHDIVCDANLQIFGSRELHGRGRVEFLPVEWHTRFHRHIDRPPDALTIHDITLDHIPLFRQFANDAFLDILYFVSSTYHKVIVEEVVGEMNRVVGSFKERTPSWSGKVSIAAHSLGAIVSFDVLANQTYQGAKPGVSPTVHRRFASCPVAPAVSPATSVSPVEDPSESVSPAIAVPEIQLDRGPPLRPAGLVNFSPVGSEKTHLLSPEAGYPSLDFQVVHLFCLGSPIGAFVMLRRLSESLNRTYRLPGGVRLYNIFHPYDPVAFRLEPIVVGGAFVTRYRLPPPQLVPTWQGGYRMQYKVRQLWRRMVEMPTELTQQGYRLVEKGLSNIGLLDADLHDTEAAKIQASIRATARPISSNTPVSPSPPSSPLPGYVLRGKKATPPLPEEPKTRHESVSKRPSKRRHASVQQKAGGEDVPFFGRLNNGDRIDYALQEKEIEIANEYVFAIGAHVIYWSSKDLSYFVAEQILASSKFQVNAETNDDAQDQEQEKEEEEEKPMSAAASEPPFPSGVQDPVEAATVAQESSLMEAIDSKEDVEEILAPLESTNTTPVEHDVSSSELD